MPEYVKLASFNEVLVASAVDDADVFEALLATVCGLEPYSAQFELVWIPLTALAGWVRPLESYTESSDPGERQAVLDLERAYRTGAAVAPPVVGVAVEATGDVDAVSVLAGAWRLAAAAAAGLRVVTVYKARRKPGY